MNPAISEVTRRIAEAFVPVKIIVFGSQATGRPEKNSDLDLLIIYDGPLTKREIKLGIRELFPHPKISMDLFVLNSDEYARQSRIPTTIGRTAALEGVAASHD